MYVFVEKYEKYQNFWLIVSGVETVVVEVMTLLVLSVVFS